MKVKEDFLHYVWKYGLYNSDYLFAGKNRIEVIDPGLHNHSSGPDFFNARVKIGDTLWAGNVEIHVKASDWYRHRHQDDPAYDNIILHMVLENDLRVNRNSGEEIPTGRFVIHSEVFRRYENLVGDEDNRICYKALPELDSLLYTDWIGKLAFKRLERKLIHVEEILKDNYFDWDDALYQVLSMALGMKVNAEPFRILSRSVPYGFILKNRHRQLTLLAAFLGQAGMLEGNKNDEFFRKLSREYNAIRSLLPEPVAREMHWKKLRNRPGGFPLVRIIQLAEILRTSFPLFEKLKNGMSVTDIRRSLLIPLKNLKENFRGSASQWVSFHLPVRATLDTWIINGIIPVLFRYGKFQKNEEIIQSVLDILEELPAETNEILKKWNTFGIYPANAFESQALIEWMTQYCRRQACTDCMLGHLMISNAGKQ